MATTWFELALELVQRTPGYRPPVASRAFGYGGLTLYEAVVPGMEGWRSLAGLPPLPGRRRNIAYHWPSVANVALAGILRFLFPSAPREQLAALAGLEEGLAHDLRPGFRPGSRRVRSRAGETSPPHFSNG